MDAFDRLKATTWEEAKEFVDIGYVSMSEEMNAVTQSIEIEGEESFDILEILSEKDKNYDDKVEILKTKNELNMDEKTFNPTKYLSIMHDNTPFNLLANGPSRLFTKILHKNKEIMHLVESHFDQFINCKDTLDKMKMVIEKAKVEAMKNGLKLGVVIKMQEKYDELMKSLANIKNLTDLKNRVDQSREAISVIERARSVFSLPAQLRIAAANRDDDRFVNLFFRAQGLSKETEIEIYQDVLKDCIIIAEKFVSDLFDLLSDLTLTRNQYDRALTTLFEMKQFPNIVLRDDPVIFLLRTHEQTLYFEYNEAISKFQQYDEEEEKKKQRKNLKMSMMSKAPKTQTKTLNSQTLTTINMTSNLDSLSQIVTNMKYTTIHQFSTKMIEHMPKLMGILQFSANKKQEVVEEDSETLRKTFVLFEDNTLISVSYSKNTTIPMFLDLALNTYKLTHPDLVDEFELCCFIGKANEQDEEKRNKAISEAILLSETDMPYELETRWTTATKELSHSFYARKKDKDKKVIEKESSSDRAKYIRNIIVDFCESMSNIFQNAEDMTKKDTLSNIQTLIDKACLEDIEKVLTAFKSQQIPEFFIEPLQKTHSELVSIFIEKITQQTRNKILALSRSIDIFVQPNVGILTAFQKIYTEDFKLLKEIIQATQNPLEQVTRFFESSINSLKEFFDIAAESCSRSADSEESRNKEESNRQNIRIDKYMDLTKQRKLLSLSENARNATNANKDKMIIWELYLFSAQMKDVINDNKIIQDMVLPFEKQSERILNIYIQDRRNYLISIVSTIDAKNYEIWIVSDINYGMIEDYALNLITELIVIKQDLHNYAISKENQCMQMILYYLCLTFLDVIQKTIDENANRITKTEEEKESIKKESLKVCIRWLMGCEFIVECCKPILNMSKPFVDIENEYEEEEEEELHDESEDSNEEEKPKQHQITITDKVYEVVSNIKKILEDNFGEDITRTEKLRNQTVKLSMKKFEALINSFKLATINPSGQKVQPKVNTRRDDDRKNISYKDVEME